MNVFRAIGRQRSTISATPLRPWESWRKTRSVSNGLSRRTRPRSGVGTREGSPLDWVRSQYSLGNALKALGELDAGADPLEQALTAYLAALELCIVKELDPYRRLIERKLGLTLLRLRERGATHESPTESN